MFICARSEQRDLVPIYTLTNTQRTRIYPGKLKFILMDGGAGRSGCSPSVLPNFCKAPFLPQILAFLCLQPPHVPVSPRTFKFPPPFLILVKISSAPGKEIQTLFTFLTTENLSGLPCHTSASTESIQICSAISIYTVIYKRVGAYLGNLIFIHFFLVFNFYPD